jgi:SAM-dependent methyltransferase
VETPFLNRSPCGDARLAASRDSAARFSSRVENYVRYRPHYPLEIVELLRKECNLRRESIIADVGSGTGMLSELFLENGNALFGVEPNPEMRAAGECLLARYPAFTSLAGKAEATTLPDRSVDFVAAGQAFHWFEPILAREEFERILRPGGWIVLVWNDRRINSTPFLAAYEQLLRTFANDYDQVNHKRIDTAVLCKFFGSPPRNRSFPNFQSFDFNGLKGRLLSSSYVPEPGARRYEPMMSALEELFSQFEREQQVVFEYDTTVFYGQLL